MTSRFRGTVVSSVRWRLRELSTPLFRTSAQNRPPSLNGLTSIILAVFRSHILSELKWKLVIRSIWNTISINNAVLLLSWYNSIFYQFVLGHPYNSINQKYTNRWILPIASCTTYGLDTANFAPAQSDPGLSRCGYSSIIRKYISSGILASLAIWLKRSK